MGKWHLLGSSPSCPPGTHLPESFFDRDLQVGMYIYIYTYVYICKYIDDRHV